MVLHKVLANELLSKEVVAISREEVGEISKYVANMLNWCSNYNPVVCEEFLKSLGEFIKSMVRLRFMKYVVHGGKQEESLDLSLMSELLSIISEYYRFLMCGLLDKNGNVVVEVLKSLEYGGMEYRRKSITSIPLKDALLLSRTGHVRLLDEVVSPHFRS